LDKPGVGSAVRPFSIYRSPVLPAHYRWSDARKTHREPHSRRFTAPGWRRGWRGITTRGRGAARLAAGRYGRPVGGDEGPGDDRPSQTPSRSPADLPLRGRDRTARARRVRDQRALFATRDNTVASLAPVRSRIQPPGRCGRTALSPGFPDNTLQQLRVAVVSAGVHFVSPQSRRQGRRGGVDRAWPGGQSVNRCLTAPWSLRRGSRASTMLSARSI